MQDLLSNYSFQENANISMSISSLLLVLVMGSFMSACEDPLPNNPPTVIGSDTYAQCERKEGHLALTQIHFVVEDLQGSDTLVTPYVAYRNVSIPMTQTSIPAPTPEELEMAKAQGQTLNKCSKESCRMQYTWEYDRSDDTHGLIRCEVEEEKVQVIISDINGNDKNFAITVSNEG